MKNLTRQKEATLSSSHLQAIGEVASEWTALEFSFQWAMVKVSQVPYFKVVAFAAPSPMNGWLGILENLLLLETPGRKLEKPISSLFQEIRKVQKKRNEIVHAVWAIQFPKDWGKDRLYATDKALGIGFPKKGKQLMVHHAYTAAEMRAVASEIRHVTEKFRGVFLP